MSPKANVHARVSDRSCQEIGIEVRRPSIGLETEACADWPSLVRSHSTWSRKSNSISRRSCPRADISGVAQTTCRHAAKSHARNGSATASERDGSCPRSASTIAALWRFHAQLAKSKIRPSVGLGIQLKASLENPSIAPRGGRTTSAVRAISVSLRWKRGAASPPFRVGGRIGYGCPDARTAADPSPQHPGALLVTTARAEEKPSRAAAPRPWPLERIALPGYFVTCGSPPWSRTSAPGCTTPHPAG